MTPYDLQAAMPGVTVQRALDFAAPLTHAMERFGIDTPRRRAAFLAQVAHESGSLRYVREIADGSAYEGRRDLGNTERGDGPRFRGRGLLQITGRDNYRACGQGLGLPLLDQPQLLEAPSHAAASAGWFWHTRKLNAHADADHFGALTRAINGGYNGLDDRIRSWLTARKALGV